MKYWFVRSPFKTRKWDDELMNGVFHLYGIRNYAAKNNINRMQKGDLALWYSSTSGKMIYGTMNVKDEAFIDETSGKNWLAIDFIPKSSLTNPLSLETIKNNKFFSDSNILKQIRISVVEISEKEYLEILRMGKISIIKV